jgi:hypothetical protein
MDPRSVSERSTVVRSGEVTAPPDSPSTSFIRVCMLRGTRSVGVEKERKKRNVPHRQVHCPEDGDDRGEGNHVPMNALP